MRPAVVLWDFGDTLVDERWMRRCPVAVPAWETCWLEVMAELADRWNVGDIDMLEVFARLAERSRMSIDEVRAHARSCCGELTLNHNAWGVAAQRRWRQAIVTVNPDVFAAFIVPAHGLGAIFDEIVMSFAERTDDKVELCDIALDRLGYDGPRERVLLIDNRPDLVEAWEQSGGLGYWFRGDDRFGRDISTLFA